MFNINNETMATVTPINKGPTLVQLQQEEERRQQEKLLPIGNWVASIDDASYKGNDKKYLVRMTVNVTDENDVIHPRTHVETFFMEQKNNYSKLPLLISFMAAVGIEDLTDESAEKIKGRRIIISVDHSLDKKNMNKKYSNITGYAAVVNDADL